MNKRGAYQKKSENKENVEARLALLEAGLKSPHEIKKSIANTLTSQRRFCSLRVTNSRISPISLNTLKSLAGELYSNRKEADGDGFAYLDAKRVRLKNLVEKSVGGRSVEARTERHSKQKAELEDKLRKVELQNIHRSKAYLDLHSKLKAFINEDAIEETVRLRLFQLVKNHDALYGSLFNPQGPPLSADSAVLIAWPTLSDEEK